MEQLTLKQHIIKSYNVMVLGIVYLLFGFASSFIINTFSPRATNHISQPMLILEIVVETGVTILFSYIIHRIVERIPLPLIGDRAAQIKIIEEVRGGIVIAFAMFSLQLKLRNKIQLLFFGQVENPQLVDLTG